MKVAIQGQAGSYHDIARSRHFENATSYPYATFEEVFKAVDSGDAEYGLIAIENSLYGSINKVYDLLLQFKPWVCGEIYLRIEHCLIARGQTPLNKITEIYSQHEALEQCQQFFKESVPQAKLIEADDTAGSVKKLENLPTSAAAVASEQAAKIHGAVILKKGIETNKQNYTRFIVFQKQKSYETTGMNKTSIVLELPEKPGALHEILGLFAKAKINLSKLESRPIIGKAWRYMFYLDFDAGVDEPSCRDILNKLKKECLLLQVLGSYKSTAQISL